MRRHEILTEEMQRPFYLEAGPLFRLVLLRLGEREHRLIRATHHLIHDAVSWQIFFDELAVAYTALVSGAPSPLGPAPALQYLDYAAWERELIRPESPPVQGRRRLVREARVTAGASVAPVRQGRARSVAARPAQRKLTALTHAHATAWTQPGRHRIATLTIGAPRTGAV
jgi:hypothetical protein